MVRVGLAYIDALNLGDVVIYDTVRYLVESILKENQITDYELVPIDIGNHKHTRKNVNSGVFKKLTTIQKQTSVCLNPEEAENVARKEWHASDLYRSFAHTELPKMKGLDMVIFCGGGLIKFRMQMFYMFLDEITAIADQEGIPVLINAAGVEGYDWDDPRCRILKKAINRECVKYISTRDDLQTLKEHYVTNPNTVVVSVSDPAVWTKEYYQISINEKTGKIGLGVVRPAIFRDYMYYVDAQRLKDVYYALAMRILDAGYAVEFFCNGLSGDYQFVEDLFEMYPTLRGNPRVTTANPQTAESLVNTISGYERILAVRLHASIIAASLDIPNVNLVWNFKQILFGNQIGYEQNYLMKDQFDDEIIYDRLMTASRPALNDGFKNSVRQELERAMMHVIKGNGL